MNIIENLNSKSLKSDIPSFRSGDTIRVHQLIQEGNKERVQIFEGVVISRSGGGINETFTVRKVSYNVGVERIFMLHSPRISKIEVKQKGLVRRAKLYYLRERQGKSARIQEAKFLQTLKKDSVSNEGASDTSDNSEGKGTETDAETQDPEGEAPASEKG